VSRSRGRQTSPVDLNPKERHLMTKEGGQETREQRSEERTILNHYRSVEFSLKKADPVLQFRVRDVSPSGMGILVNDRSEALKHLKVGQVLNMTYNPEEPDDSPINMQTEIRHITPMEEGRFKGHTLVGLLIKSGSSMKPEKE